MSKNPWINPASHGGQTKQGQDAYDKSKGIVRTATGRGVPMKPKAPSKADAGANWHGTKTDAEVGDAHTAEANKWTERANKSGIAGEHSLASSKHLAAAEYHEAQGNKLTAQSHRNAAQAHDDSVTSKAHVKAATQWDKALSDGGGGHVPGAKVRSEHGTEGTITKASKTGDVEVLWNGKGGDMSRDKYTASEAKGALTRIDAAPRAMQTGAKGGSFYLTATGRKIYKKQ